MAITTNTFKNLNNYKVPSPDKLNLDYWNRRVEGNINALTRHEGSDTKDAREYVEEMPDKLKEFDKLIENYTGKLSERKTTVEALQEKSEYLHKALEEIHKQCEETDVSNTTTGKVKKMLDQAEKYESHMVKAIDTLGDYQNEINQIKINTLIGSKTEELFQWACEKRETMDSFGFLKALHDGEEKEEIYNTYIIGSQSINNEWTKQIRMDRNSGTDYDDLDFETPKKNCLINLGRDLKGPFQYALEFDSSSTSQGIYSYLASKVGS